MLERQEGRILSQDLRPDPPQKLTPSLQRIGGRQRNHINSTMMMNGIAMPKGFKAVVPTQRRHFSPPPVQHSAPQASAAPEYYSQPPVQQPQVQYQYVATGQTPPPMQAPAQYYVVGESPQPMQQAGGSAVPVAAAPQYYYTPTVAAPQQQYQYVAAATPQPQAQPAVQYVAVQRQIMYQPTGMQYQYVASTSQQPAAAQAAPVASQSPQPMMQNASSTAAVAKTWASAQPMAQYGSAQPMTQYAMPAAAPGVMDYSSYLNAPTGSSLTAEQCAQLGVPIGTVWGASSSDRQQQQQIGQDYGYSGSPVGNQYQGAQL